MKPLLILVLLSASLGVRAQSDADLEITLDSVRNAKGTLRLSLYRAEDAFRKEGQAFRVLIQPARSGKPLLRFDKLPPGRYALMAYHDENANERLDLRLGMFPLEGYGLSNNPKVFGPPAFADSAFELPEGGAHLTLQLNY